MKTNLVNLVESARKATAPIVGIPIPGERPFCVRRDLLVSSLRGLTIIDAGIQLPLAGQRRSARLVVYAAGDRVQAIRRFAPLESYAPLLEWTRNERKKHTTPKVRTSARQKEIAKLRKKLAKLRTPKAPQHPLLYPKDTAGSIQRNDTNRLREWERWCAADDHVHEKPLTLGQEWARYKEQASTRRWIQAQARECRAGKLTTTQLYRCLAERGITARKWSDLRTHDKERCHDVWGYLANLWEFCGLATKPKYHFEPATVYEMGREHYADYLEWVVEHKQLVSLIDTLEQLENGGVQ